MDRWAHIETSRRQICQYSNDLGTRRQDRPQIDDLVGWHRKIYNNRLM